MIDKINLILGESHIDDRGKLKFFNEISLKEWERFYTVENHDNNFIRAWHGHKNESKLVFPLTGVAVVCTVKIDNWEKPSRDLAVNTTVLSSQKPRALYIPAGYANGFKNLTNSTQLMFFSSTSTEESKDDDFRFPWDYWNPWESNYR